MRKLFLIGVSILLLSSMNSCIAIADTPQTSVIAHQDRYNMPVPFIFIENGVEFAIYPNGEFDFAYVGKNYAYNPYASAHKNFSYNGGYNYDLYVQFDRYGAVIQVESVPIYYDYYGRITRAGNVRINYRNNYVSQIGMMHIVYNTHFVYDYSYGYINSYNRAYHAQPWHHYYARPVHTVIYSKPYRRDYNPIRYSYQEHKVAYENRGRSNQDYSPNKTTNVRRTFLDPATNQPRTQTSNTTGRRENSNLTPTNTNKGDINTNTERPTNSSTSTTTRRETVDNEKKSSTTESRKNNTTTEKTQRNTSRTTSPATNTTQKTETRRTPATNTRGSSNQKVETKQSSSRTSKATNTRQTSSRRN